MEDPTCGPLLTKEEKAGLPWCTGEGCCLRGPDRPCSCEAPWLHGRSHCAELIPSDTWEFLLPATTEQNMEHDEKKMFQLTRVLLRVLKSASDGSKTSILPIMIK